MKYRIVFKQYEDKLIVIGWQIVPFGHDESDASPYVLYFETVPNQFTKGLARSYELKQGKLVRYK